MRIKVWREEARCLGETETRETGVKEQMMMISGQEGFQVSPLVSGRAESGDRELSGNILASHPQPHPPRTPFLLQQSMAKPAPHQGD